MAEEFLLECKLDQPAVPSGRSADVYSLITIKPNVARIGALMESGEGASLPAHLIVVVDVSGSMHMLIEPDPNARTLGSSTIEGRSMSEVESNVPSRRMVAVNVVLRLVEQMGPSDRMTLIAFDDQAHPLARGLGRGRELDDAVRQLADVGGGGTALGAAFSEVRKSLSRAGASKRATSSSATRSSSTSPARCRPSTSCTSVSSRRCTDWPSGGKASLAGARRFRLE